MVIKQTKSDLPFILAGIYEVTYPSSAPRHPRSSPSKVSVDHVPCELEMRTYPKDHGMIEVMEEDIEVRTQVVLVFWSGLREVFVVFRVERRRNSSEHPTNCETCIKSKVG